MPGAPTPNLGLVVPTDGGDTGVWGPEVNTNWAILDSLGVFAVQNPSATGNVIFGVAPTVYVMAIGGVAGIGLALPAPITVPNRLAVIKKVDTAVGSIIISTPAGSIDGQPTYTLFNRYQYVSLLSANGIWNVVGK